MADPQTLDAGFKSFGFGRKTGIDFKGEASGQLLPPSKYADSGLREPRHPVTARS